MPRYTMRIGKKDFSVQLLKLSDYKNIERLKESLKKKTLFSVIQKHVIRNCANPSNCQTNV